MGFILWKTLGKLSLKGSCKYPIFALEDNTLDEYVCSAFYTVVFSIIGLYGIIIMYNSIRTKSTMRAL